MVHTKERLNAWQDLTVEANDLLEIARLDVKDKRVNLRSELEARYLILRQKFNQLKLEIYFTGCYDQFNVFLSFYAGAGGTDAQDWTQMLQRMYLRYCSHRGWSVKIISQIVGNEAGIKSSILEIKGDYVYGYLKSEMGVHRLVRISPFDAEKMRHTSFALVEVVPQLLKKEIAFQPDELRIDTFLSSGAGGQSVQKNQTAVRITHLPTKISVACQSERSQKQNKEIAIQLLIAKLTYYYQQQQAKQKKAITGQIESATWGKQIRSYVLHPYKMVKDHRTNKETKDVDAVLDGDIDPFIEAYLLKLYQTKKIKAKYKIN